MPRASDANQLCAKKRSKTSTMLYANAFFFPGASRLSSLDWFLNVQHSVHFSTPFRCEEEIIDDARVEGTMIYLPPEASFSCPTKASPILGRRRTSGAACGNVRLLRGLENGVTLRLTSCAKEPVPRRSMARWLFCKK